MPSCACHQHRTHMQPRSLLSIMFPVLCRLALRCAAVPTCAAVLPVLEAPVPGLVALRAPGQAASPGHLCQGGRQVPPHCQEDGGDGPAAQDSSTVRGSTLALAVLGCWRRCSRGRACTLGSRRCCGGRTGLRCAVFMAPVVSWGAMGCLQSHVTHTPIRTYPVRTVTCHACSWL